MELNEMLLFARTFLQEPKMLGSVIPSSRFLIRRLLRHVNWQAARVIVEYGPGVGNITAEILQQLRPDGLLVGIEMNRVLAQHVRGLDAKRLRVVNDSAERVRPILAGLHEPQADYVFSGIPFSTMPKSVGQRIVQETHAALRPGGEFLVYQFSAAVLPMLQQTFERVEIEMEPLNVLPARIFRCIKQRVV